MDPISTPPLPTVNNLGRATARRADEKTALKSFDAFFVGEMLKRSMPEKTTGLFDGGDAGRMYQEHLFQELARMIAEKGDFGIASSLEGTLTPRDASSPAPAPAPTPTPTSVLTPEVPPAASAEKEE